MFLAFSRTLACSSSLFISIVHLSFQSTCTQIVIVSSIVIASSYFGQDSRDILFLFQVLSHSSSDK